MAWGRPWGSDPCSVRSLPGRARGLWWTGTTVGVGLQSSGVGAPIPIPRCWDFTPQAHLCASVSGASHSGGLPASRVSTSRPHSGLPECSGNNSPYLAPNPRGPSASELSVASWGQSWRRSDSFSTRLSRPFQKLPRPQASSSSRVPSRHLCAPRLCLDRLLHLQSPSRRLASRHLFGRSHLFASCG